MAQPIREPYSPRSSRCRASRPFFTRLKPSDIAWMALGAGVLIYDLTARDGSTLSEAVDDYLLRHPILTRAVVIFTAGHLLNAYPQWVDPWALTFIARQRLLQVRSSANSSSAPPRDTPQAVSLQQQSL